MYFYTFEELLPLFAAAGLLVAAMALTHKPSLREPGMSDLAMRMITPDPFIP
jgi:hypothetical protein